MKEYAVAYQDSGVKSFARFNASSPEDAKKKLLRAFPTAKAGNAFEMTPQLDALLQIVHQMPDEEFERATKSVEDFQKQRAEYQRQEELRKSKFKKYQGQQADNGINDAWRQSLGNQVLANAEKGELSSEDWNKLLTAVGQKDRDAMYEEFKKDAQEHWKDDPQNLAKELQFIDHIFGKRKGWKKTTMSIRDIAAQWGTSHVYVSKVTKQAMAKLLKEIARRCHYPYKIKDFEDAKKLLMSDKWDPKNA